MRPRGGDHANGELAVTHVITSLDVGGAETALLRLLRAMAPSSAFRSTVLCIAPEGPLASEIRDLDVSVWSLGVQRWAQLPGAFLRLRRLLAELRPDVVQTWMYHADLLGGLAARTTVAAPVIWNIRMSDHDPRGFRRSTLALIRMNAVVSRWLADRIVCVSSAARDVHLGLGYDPSKIDVIPNGVPLTSPDRDARSAIRMELGIPQDALLVGRIARYHPMKDHRTLIEAIRIVTRECPDVFWLLCGAGVDEDNPELAGWLEAAGIGDRVRLAGLRQDIPRIHAGLDLACSSSAYGEGFPNVIAEAMATGVPAVVTDVGDSALLVGETGIVVPPRDPAALAQGILRLLADADLRRRLGDAARARVDDTFSLRQMAERYADLYRAVV